MESIWQDISLPHFRMLDGDTSTDVLVIGGGMAGLLCAHRLQQAGVSCLVAEAAEICGGITKNTTAKITSQHGLCFHKLLTRFGPETARLYLEANQKAVKRYRELCRNIDCDFAEEDNYIYARSDRAVLERELAALDALGFPAKLAENLPLPFPTVGAVKFPGQARFHPLKFLAALARDLHIYEYTPIRQLVKHTAITDRGTIRAEKIIVATHFPFLNKHGSYYLKLYQHRSYVIALENTPQINGMYVDQADLGLSFRNYENLLLLGGGSHKTGKQGGNWQELRDFKNLNYPESTEVAYWATQDCMTLDSIPYIGRYSNKISFSSKSGFAPSRSNLFDPL